MRPKPLFITVAWGALGLVAVAVIADSLGLAKPRSSFASVRSRMLTSWQAMDGYHAQVSVGEWGGGAPGVPSTVLQWYSKADDDLALATSDLGGFRHAERWRGGVWSFYQPGAEIQADVRMLSAADVPFARWLVTKSPTLGDLVGLIADSDSGRVAGSEVSNTGEAWVVWCEPRPPARLAALPASHPAHGFSRRFFDRPWKIHISRNTDLPEHIIIAGRGSEPATRLAVEELRSLSEMPSDWKAVVGKSGARPRIMSLSCDLPSARGLITVQERIQTAVDAWRRPLLQRGSEPPAPVTPKDTPR